MGVLAAFLKFIEDSTHVTSSPTSPAWGAFGGFVGAWGNWIGLMVFLLLAWGLYWDACREKVEA